MTKYNPTKKEYYELEYHELDKIVNEYFGFERTPCDYSHNGFSFVACEEMNNDSEKEFSNITKAEYESEQGEDFLMTYEHPKGYFPVGEYIKAGKCPQYCTYHILLELVGHDIIPEGNYLITVCW